LLRLTVFLQENEKNKRIKTKYLRRALAHSLQFIYNKTKIDVCASMSWQKTAGYSFFFYRLPIYPYSHIDNANNRMRCMPIRKRRKKNGAKNTFFFIRFCSLVALVLKVIIYIYMYTQWTQSYIYIYIYYEHYLEFSLSLSFSLYIMIIV